MVGLAFEELLGFFAVEGERDFMMGDDVAMGADGV